MNWTQKCRFPWGFLSCDKQDFEHSPVLAGKEGIVLSENKGVVGGFLGQTVTFTGDWP